MREVQVRVIPLTVADGGPRIKIVVEAVDGANAEVVMSLENWLRMIAKPGTNVKAEWHQEDTE